MTIKHPNDNFLPEYGFDLWDVPQVQIRISRIPHQIYLQRIVGNLTNLVDVPDADS